MKRFAGIILICGTLCSLAGEQAIPGNWKYDGNFNKLIANADRIIIRDGGLDCCGPVDKQKVLFEIKDSTTVKDFAAHMVILTNQTYNPGAAFCGYPGIDWYKGTNRIALTAFHSHIGLLWKGFKGVAEMERESRIWLSNWFLARSIKGPNGEVTREESANKVQEDTR